MKLVKVSIDFAGLKTLLKLPKDTIILSVYQQDRFNKAKIEILMQHPDAKDIEEFESVPERRLFLEDGQPCSRLV